MKSSKYLVNSVLLSLLLETAGYGQMPMPIVSGKAISVTVLGRAQGAADACRVTTTFEETSNSVADINRLLEGQKVQLVEAAKAAGVEEKAITVEGADFTSAQGPGLFGNMGPFPPPVPGPPGAKPAAYRGTLAFKVEIPFNVSDMEGSLDRAQKLLDALNKATNKPLPFTITFVARDMQGLHDKAFEDGFAKARVLAQKLAAITGKQLGDVEGVVFADTKEIMGQLMGGMFGGGMMRQILGLASGHEGSTNPHRVAVEETLTFSFQIGERQVLK